MVVYTRAKPFLSETKVLINELPEGIMITLENSIRLLDDSILLAQHGKYENAIVNVTLAWEEFAKTILLCEHFENGLELDMKQSDNKAYFEEHDLRIAKVEEFFHTEILKSQMGPNWSKSMGFLRQRSKLKYLYTDWSQGWQSPTYRTPTFTRHRPLVNFSTDFLRFSEFHTMALQLLDCMKLILQKQCFADASSSYDPDTETESSQFENQFLGKTYGIECTLRGEIKKVDTDDKEIITWLKNSGFKLAKKQPSKYKELSEEEIQKTINDKIIPDGIRPETYQKISNAIRIKEERC